jgi:hypothetical protein
VKSSDVAFVDIVALTSRDTANDDAQDSVLSSSFLILVTDLSDSVFTLAAHFYVSSRCIGARLIVFLFINSYTLHYILHLSVGYEDAHL